MVRRVISKNISIFSSISSSLASVGPLTFQIYLFRSSLNGSSSFLHRRHYHESRNIPVSVWWDFENCSPPSDVNVIRTHHYIKEAVRRKGIMGPLTIKAFGNVYQLSRANQEALASTGIKIIHVPKGGKNSADKSLLIDLMFWVSQNPPPAHLFLISSDRDFAEVLHRLRMSNYNILIAGLNTPYILCNVATVIWPWNSLLKGENLDGIHFNHPPDSFYGSWCDHNDAPLAEAFFSGKQFARSQTEEFLKSTSDLNVRPIPKAVVRQLHQILNLYPNGVSLAQLPAMLEKAGTFLDKDFYGYKRFSLFLSSVVCIQVRSDPKRGLVAHYVPEGSPEPIVPSKELDHAPEKINADHKYAEPTKKEPLTFLGWIKSWWPSRKKVGNTHNMTAQGNEMVSNAKDPELSNLKQGVSHSEEPQSLKQRQKASQFKEPELSELGQTINHYGEPELFSCSSFWKEVESFVFSSKGEPLVTHSRNRKEMVIGFQKYGPHVLHSLSENDLLLLVDLLISEKNWLEERPSETFPFRANPNRATQSDLQKSSEFEVDKKPSVPHAGVSSPATRNRSSKKSRMDILADLKKLVCELLREFPNGCNMGLIPTRFLEKYGYPLDIEKLDYSKLSLLLQTLPGVRTKGGHFLSLNLGLRNSGKETSTLKTQHTKVSDVVSHYSENEFYDSLSEDNKEDSPWEELGPVSVSDSNKCDLESNPTEKAIELRTAIAPNYESDLSEDDYPEPGGDDTCLIQSEYDHVFPANHDTYDSDKETSTLKTRETKQNVVCHYSEDEFYDSEYDRKDSTSEEPGPVSVSDPDESDQESKPRQEAIEMKTSIDPDCELDLFDDDSSEAEGHHSCLTHSEEEDEPKLNREDNSLQNLDSAYGSHEGEDSLNTNKANTEGNGLSDGLNAPRIYTPDYEHDLSDDDSSESGGDNSCLTQSDEEGELKLNGEDSLQNLDSEYGTHEREDIVNQNKANVEGNALAGGLNSLSISAPATGLGNHLGGYKEKHKPKKNFSFHVEPDSHQNKVLIGGLLQCFKGNDTTMPN